VQNYDENVAIIQRCQKVANKITRKMCFL